MGGASGKLVSRPRLDNKVAVVTGSNTGIGKVTAKELYKLANAQLCSSALLAQLSVLEGQPSSLTMRGRSLLASYPDGVVYLWCLAALQPPSVDIMAPPLALAWPPAASLPTLAAPTFNTHVQLGWMRIWLEDVLWRQGEVEPECPSWSRLTMLTGATGVHRQGARVIMACRDVSRGEAAVAEIKEGLEGEEGLGELLVERLDLGDLGSVRECARAIAAAQPAVHLLVNNAGVMMVPKGVTADGFESHLGVNHLGHFLFTCLLLPNIKAAAPARIINVSSSAHLRGRMVWEDLNWERRPYSALGAYCQSKLANVLFSLELSRRLQGTGVTVYSLHPGVVKTELGRHISSTYFKGARTLANILFAPFYKTPEEGALTTLYCALDPQLADHTDLYYSDCKVSPAGAAAQDQQAAAKLWLLSTQLVGLSADPLPSS